MNHFQYQGSSLFCEEIPLQELAVTFGTPLYVYSYATLARHYRAFDEALTDVDHLVCYAVKANANLALLRAIGRMGGGADVVSGGELFRALEAKIPGERIVYSGVGKTIPEIEYALRKKILLIHIESAQELEQVSKTAEKLGVRAKIGFRLNPDVDPKTHPHIATGLRQSKFGLSRDKLMELCREATKDPNVEPVGISLHIGSQITELHPFVEAVTIACDTIRDLDRIKAPIRYLDCGGGLGVQYQEEEPPSLPEYAKALKPLVKGLNIKLILEPGRALMGNAGVLLTRVVRIKKSDTKTFVVVDSGMNDLIRPALYGAVHRIEPVIKRGSTDETVDVVGPLCESSDFFAKDYGMERAAEGDILCIRTAGAYGFSMSSQYNARPRASEVLVHGEEVDVIRKRETFDDLIRGEKIPRWLEKAE